MSGRSAEHRESINSTWLSIAHQLEQGHVFSREDLEGIVIERGRTRLHVDDLTRAMQDGGFAKRTGVPVRVLLMNRRRNEINLRTMGADDQRSNLPRFYMDKRIPVDRTDLKAAVLRSLIPDFNISIQPEPTS